MKVFYLIRSDLITINKKTIEIHGGNFVSPENILFNEGLEYLIESVSAKLFSKEIYPNLWDKAAVYMFNIINNHVFQDGNKRTGLEASIIFLRLNNHRLNPKVSNESLFNFTIKVAEGKMSLDEVKKWFRAHVVHKMNV